MQYFSEPYYNKDKYWYESCTGLPALKQFLENNYNKKNFLKNTDTLYNFALLDDYDIYASIKVWCQSSDKILSVLSQRLINRNLFKIEMQNTEFDIDYINTIKERTIKKYSLDKKDVNYFVFSNTTSNSIYSQSNDNIKILFKNNQFLDITEASDQLDKNILSKTIVKYFLCYPKDI